MCFQLVPVLKKSKAELQKEVVAMLQEIGLDRKLYIIRWLGIFTTKVLCRMYTSAFVNEKNIFAVRRNIRITRDHFNTLVTEHKYKPNLM